MNAQKNIDFSTLMISDTCTDMYIMCTTQYTRIGELEDEKSVQKKTALTQGVCAASAGRHWPLAIAMGSLKRFLYTTQRISRPTRVGNVAVAHRSLIFSFLSPLHYRQSVITIFMHTVCMNQLQKEGKKEKKNYFPFNNFDIVRFYFFAIENLSKKTSSTKLQYHSTKEKCNILMIKFTFGIAQQFLELRLASDIRRVAAIYVAIRVARISLQMYIHTAYINVCNK